jgi:hypothetical protein
MRIFISHSGDRSRELAEHVASFVKDMIQATDPWISTGMDKGLKWLPEIAANLEASDFGIVCLTKENLPNAWILFETGALAKRLNDKVCPLLLDIENKNDVSNPLGQFQSTKAGDKDDVWKLVMTITKEVRAAGSNPPTDEALKKTFEEYHWPKFEALVERLKARGSSVAPPKRPVEDMVSEVLTTVRQFTHGSLFQPTLMETIQEIAYHISAIYSEQQREWHRTQSYAHELDGELRALQKLRLPDGDGLATALAELQAMAEARRRVFVSGDLKQRLADLRSTAEFTHVLGLDRPKATEKDS